VITDFDTKYPRKYWAFGPGRSAEDAVWHQAVQAEVAHHEDRETGGVIWDGTKYYESFDLGLLKDRALRHGIDPVIVKTTFNYWRGPRLLRLGAEYSALPYFASSGLPAGDIFNDIMVRVYSIEAFDTYVAENPDIVLSSYVDDDSVTTSGSEQQVLSTVARAAASLFILFRDELHVGIQPEKVSTFASSLSLAKKIAALLGQYAGQVTNSVVSLGTDFAPGQRRGAKRGLWKRKQRLCQMKKSDTQF